MARSLFNYGNSKAFSIDVTNISMEDFMEQLNKVLHDGSFKVLPAAGWWMRAFMVLPSEVKPTGPKGHITKGDVLSFIEGNILVLGERKAAAEAAPKSSKPESKPAVAAKKQKAAKKAAPKKVNPMKDPNDPFK